MLNLDTPFEAKRQEMIEAGLILGLTHPRVVELSQELDRLHNLQLRREMGIGRVADAACVQIGGWE